VVAKLSEARWLIVLMSATVFGVKTWLYIRNTPALFSSVVGDKMMGATSGESIYVPEEEEGEYDGEDVECYVGGEECRTD
jgi:hypothetical protein